MNGTRHCPQCWTEFVARVSECTDCGGPLVEGELPRQRPARKPPADGAATAAAPTQDEQEDTLIMTLPGAQADLVARTLVMEGMSCSLECEGIRQRYAPNVPSPGPLAATLNVDIRVAAANAEEARQMIDSILHDDVIGEQWSETAEAKEVTEEISADADTVAVPVASAEDDGDDEPLGLPNQALAPQREGTGLRLLVIGALVLAAALLLLRYRF